MTAVRVRVGDVLKLERRPVVVEPATEYTTIGVRSFGKGILHYEPTTGDRVGKLRFFAVEPQRLVVSNIKGWEGAVAVSSDADSHCIASNRFLTYAPIDERIDIRWAKWFFLTEHGNELLQRASPGSADRNRTLAIDRFEALEIPLPPIDEQRSVRRRLDGVEAAAADLRQHTARANELNAALGVSLALRPDMDDEGKRRAGWTHSPLSDVLRPSQRSVGIEPTSTYLIAGIYSFGRGLIDRGPITGAETSYASLTRLAAGDIVVSKLNGWEGAVAVVEDAFDGHHVSSEYPTFTPDPDRLLPSYFTGVAQARSFWADLNASARGSMVRRRRTNPAEFLATKVWLPPMEQQAEIAITLEQASEAATARRAVTERIDALLPAARNRQDLWIGFPLITRRLPGPAGSVAR